MRPRNLFLILLLVAVTAGSFMPVRADVRTPAVLPLRERARVYDQWLTNRLDTVLPGIMRREGIDMWLVICREYEEDPVYLSLVPSDSFSARRLSMLVFYDRGREGLEKFTVGRYGIGGLYKAVWDPDKIGQWERLAEVVRERNPRRIGIDESDVFAFGDGLSASNKAALIRALGPELSKRLVKADRLAVGWLERRTPEEMEVYGRIMAIAHAIIAEAFSAEVITPGATTAEDVVWWMRDKIAALKLTTWFQPSISILRPKSSPFKDSTVIHRGDMLHCDMGIVYLGLCTDTQQLAYILKEGETDAPLGLKDGLAQGNRLQEILMAEYREGRTGNEILAAALNKARESGLRPSIYTHPLGVHGHAAGPTIGLWDRQNGVPGAGDYPLFASTCYSIELNVTAAVPEWGGQDVQFALEQDAFFDREGARFLDARQTAFHLIR
jgi:Xaa-Pro aminopeptidase